MAAATDLLVIFVALEILSLSVYVLTGIRRASAAGAEAAFKYFLLGAFSSAFFLYGIAFAFARLRLDAASSRSASRSSSQAGAAPPTLALLAVGLLAVGFCFKVSAVPFHMWTPDAYEGRADDRHGVHVDRRQGGGVRGVRPRLPLAARAAPGAVDPAALGDRGGHDDPRRGRRRRADQRQAHARLLEHRARRLPAARHHRRQQHRQGARSSSTC